MEYASCATHTALVSLLEFNPLILALVLSIFYFASLSLCQRDSMTYVPDLTDVQHRRHSYTIDVGSSNLSYEHSPVQFTPQSNAFEQEVITFLLKYC